MASNVPEVADASGWDERVECWQCNGTGRIAGCFEDCCSGADCDPDDPELCCAPSRCDICRGKGWYPFDATPPEPQEPK